MIKYFKSDIGQEEKEAVIKVLESGWLTHGEKCEEFEEKFALECKVKYALSCNSGTAGLHLALLGLGIGKGDEVITSLYTYCATWQAIQYVGAIPIFVDIEEGNYHLDPEKIQNKITTKTKAILPIHIAGIDCNMKKIKEIAEANELYIIEDCAHCFPQELYGDVAIYSFYANKNITTGEGGMLVTNDYLTKEKTRKLRYHGRDRYSGKYSVDCLGYKYNMSDILAAIGIEQLKSLFGKRMKREAIKRLYEEYLPQQIDKCIGSHLCMIQGTEEIREQLYKHLIGYSHHYNLFGWEIYEHDIPVSIKKSINEISLPMHDHLQDWEIVKICKVIKDAHDK